MLEEVSRGRENEAALEEEGRSPLSYGEVNAQVRSFVIDLRSAGVKRDNRVAVVIPNGREMCTTLLGVCSAAIAAPLNPDYQEGEFADYFREIRVTYLVIRRGMPSPARAAAAKMGIRVLELTPEADAILPEGEKVRPTRGGGEIDLPDPHDLALILLTSGSTGRSKKVPLTHRNLCVSVRDIWRTLELTPGDRCLCMWEQFHIGGLVDLLMVPLASGGSVICTRGFDAARFFDLLESKSPTWYQGVPATVHELMAHARKHGIAGVQSRLRFVRVTASALSPRLMEELETFFGVPVITTFGMTEAAPLITTNLLPPHVRKPGSTGPTCGPEIVIRDEDGRLLETGEVGEVLIRGENIISGYEDAPEANARSFRDGWFRTGDTGCLDEDGYLFLKGRIKESINRGGEKITPQEIDDVLLTHPEIAEAISFHIPHRVLGEDVAVAIVLHKSGSLTESNVREYVAARMVEFKVPRKVIFVDRFERNASGKVNRSTLAEALGLQAPAEFEEPATPMEKTLAGIWQRELNIPRVGRNDSYAELGGDSLSTARMMLEVEKKLGGDFSLKDISMIQIGVSPLREVAAKLDNYRQGDARPIQESRASEDTHTQAWNSRERFANMGVVFARILERLLPIPILRIVFWPEVARLAFAKWLLYRKHDWKSTKLPEALRCKGNGLVFLWNKNVTFFYRQILTCLPDRLSKPRWLKRIRFEGLHNLQSIVERKEPIVLATLHFGHQKLLRYLLSVGGIDCAMLVQGGEKSNRKLRFRDALLDRSRKHSRPIPSLLALDVLTLSKTMKYLQEGNALLTATDVGMGQQFVSEIPGGGGTFQMAAGPIRLARMTGAKLLPCLLSEEKPWHFVVHVGEPIDVGQQDSDQDNQAAANSLVSAFWPIVSARPILYDCGPLSFWKANNPRVTLTT